MRAAPTIAEIRDRLDSHRYVAGTDDSYAWRAATAIVITPGDRGPEVAFIRRTERVGDPWSGHMALPGGRHDHTDTDLAATAVREAREEVGLELTSHIARLPDQVGRRSHSLIAAFVHIIDDRPVLRPEPREVAEALWIPLDRLLDPAATIRISALRSPGPAIEHDGRIIWGLTHRILRTFIAAIAAPDPLRQPPVAGASTAAPNRRSRR